MNTLIIIITITSTALCTPTITEEMCMQPIDTDVVVDILPGVPTPAGY